MFRFSNLIIFEMTRDCNINCKYCYVLDKEKFKGEVISFDLFKKIVNRIAEQRIVNKLGDIPLQFNFHGGEALLVGKSHFKRCVDYLREVFDRNNLELNIGLQTNGTLLDDEWFEIFKHYNMSIGVSFDSFSEKKPLRFSKETQDNLLEKICKAKELGISVGLLSVYSKYTKKNINKDIAFQKQKGLTFPRKINFLEDTRTPRKSKYEVNGKDIFRFFLKKELDNFLKTGKLLEQHTKDLLTDCLLDLLTNHTEHYKSGCNGLICGAGLQMLAVRPDGTMGYCDRYSREMSENFIEHCLDYDFLGLYQLKKVIDLDVKKHEILKNTGCDHCRARFICEGGCSAFYYSKFHTYGIQKSLVCDQFIPFYDYVKKNLLKIIKLICTNEQAANSIKLYNPQGTSFISFKKDILDMLYNEGFLLKKVKHWNDSENFEIKIFPVKKLK